MRRILVLLVLLACLAAVGVAVADDPTCGTPGGPPSGEECPGDNGNAGCRGIDTASQYTPDQADAGLDMVRDILEPGNGDGENGCE